MPAHLFSADALRAHLPLFDPWQPSADDPLLQDYRQYYGLDFGQRLPAVAWSVGRVRVAGFDIAVQGFRPAQPRGTVFVVHGYYDHVGLYEHLIEALLQDNFAVLAFDLPGHGLSSGARAAIDNFHRYQPVLQKMLQLGAGHWPKPWHCVAQSTGGAIVSEYLLGFADQPGRIPFASVVLLAPLVRPVNWWFNRHVHSLLSPFAASIPRKYPPSSHDSDFLHFVQYADPLQSPRLSTRWVGALKQWIPFLERQPPLHFPLLIIQGQQDETVDWRHNVRILQDKFPEARLHLMPDLRHQVVNESAPIRTRVFCHMADFLNRQPASR